MVNKCKATLKVKDIIFKDKELKKKVNIYKKICKVKKSLYI